MQAMKLMGHNFKEFDSNSTVMIVVEGQQALGPDDCDRPDRARLTMTAARARVAPRWRPVGGGAMGVRSQRGAFPVGRCNPPAYL